jgi:hypothetical protein
MRPDTAAFHYHFPDMDTGRRTWKREVSTIDSTLLVAGALLAAEYFDRGSADERRVRELAEALYRRMGWDWTSTYDWRDNYGISADDGPAPAEFEIDGVRRRFLGCAARGAPFGADDGTFSPWVVVAALPFAPEVVCPR